MNYCIFFDELDFLNFFISFPELNDSNLLKPLFTIITVYFILLSYKLFIILNSNSVTKRNKLVSIIIMPY